MKRKECIAMILAGGKGERLGSLTNHIAKPVVCFGGKYRIIDFTLSNCTHSGIDSLGVLTQYKPMALHDYISNGQPWDLTRLSGGAFMLPSSRHGGVYTGTANAVYQNIDFIEKFNPEHVLVLSGDHVYKMDYGKLLDFHKKKDADITISVIPVPLAEASRFGIMSVNGDGKVTEFAEKPKDPQSNLASMGIYLFKWSRLKKYLIADQDNHRSEHDFGKNIIPAALSDKESIYAYEFEGYWRDVGTIQSLWESHMDLIKEDPPINLYDNQWKILTRTQYHAPCYLSAGAEVKRSIVAEGCHVYGKLSNSILFDSVTVEEGAEVTDSVLMPGVTVGRGARVNKSVVGVNTFVGANTEIGAEEGIRTFLDKRICSKDISLIGSGICIDNNIKIIKNSHISEESVPKEFLHTTENRDVINVNLVYV